MKSIAKVHSMYWCAAGVLAVQVLAGCGDAGGVAEKESSAASAHSALVLHPTGAKRDPSSMMNAMRVFAAPPSTPLPSLVDLTAVTPTPGDQQSEGSCVGWAVGYSAKTNHEATEETWAPGGAHRFSPSWVYNQINGGKDQGSYVSDALNLLVSKGADTLDNFPYVDGDVTTRPDAASLSRAARFKSKSWHTLAVSESQFKNVLAGGTPIVIAFEVLPDYDWLDSSSNTVYDSGTGASRGGHANAIIGYDDARHTFLIINSWGTGWGSGGYGWLDYGFITNSALGLDAYVLVDDTNQHVFAQSVWESTFSDSNGFNQAQYPLAYADIDGDGRDDLCGRAIAGLLCAKSTGSSFAPLDVWQTDFSDANGWNAPEYYSTIRYPDVDGDGKADTCARGVSGILCSISNGSSFSAPELWTGAFSDWDGWNVEPAYSTIAFPDVNADGMADVCGRGPAGVTCAISNGSSFGTASVWEPNFSDASGWNVPEYYSTIRFADVNGDRNADLCGRGTSGVYCAISNGSSFTNLSVWNSEFSNAAGWNLPQYYATLGLQDVNGDGMADVCGRGGAGVYCALSTGSAFGALALWHGSFSDANGWNQAKHYESIQYPDVNRDGKADMCGRGGAGLYCAVSDGTQSFKNFALYDSSLSDGNGWDQAIYYQSIKFTNAERDVYKRLCYRAIAGVICR